MRSRLIFAVALMVGNHHANAQETALVFACKLSETSRIYDLDGNGEDHADPDRTVVIKASAGSFQIYSDREKLWSANFCLADTPQDQASTLCRMGPASVEARWPVSQLDRIHNAQNIWAEIGLSGQVGYKISVQEDGSVKLLYRKTLNLDGVAYYEVRPNGSKQYRSTAARVTSSADHWAGYSLEARGQGSCNRIQ